VTKKPEPKLLRSLVSQKLHKRIAMIRQKGQLQKQRPWDSVCTPRPQATVATKPLAQGQENRECLVCPSLLVAILKNARRPRIPESRFASFPTMPHPQKLNRGLHFSESQQSFPTMSHPQQ
jgi:hypothetical protein